MIIEKFIQRNLYPLALFREHGKSFLKKAQTIFGRPVVHFAKKYDTQPILLLALYETGGLRPDVVRMLRCAKMQGYFTIGVNTLKLHDSRIYSDLLDCYIEKCNFGRDFGSYKEGFNFIYTMGFEVECPRVLMLNDSIFYATKGLDQFLAAMRAPKEDVLGATENFEIEHHIGSFCLSFSNRIINNKKFQKFWKSYKNTDVRPKVIRRGEMKLSKTLKRIVKTEKDFIALYSFHNFLKSLMENTEILNEFFEISRKSNRVDWGRFTSSELVKRLVLTGNHLKLNELRRPSDTAKSSIFSSNSENLLADSFYSDSFEVLVETLCNNVVSLTRSEVRKLATGMALSIFMSGSQIHQNATWLLRSGLPLVKLDLLYRGMLDEEDLTTLLKEFFGDERDELAYLLSKRPFGSDFLTGLNKVAFERGLI
jgi:hypothetical protein